MRKTDPDFKIRIDVCSQNEVTPESIILSNISENSTQKPLTVLDKGNICVKLRQRDKQWTQEKLAEIFNTSQPVIGQWLRLQELDTDSKQALRDGRLTYSDAIMLTKIDESVRADTLKGVMKVVKKAKAQEDKVTHKAKKDSRAASKQILKQQARVEGVKVGRSRLELVSFLKDRNDTISTAILEFLGGSIDSGTLAQLWSNAIESIEESALAESAIS